jgi:hypothetical protein
VREQGRLLLENAALIKEMQARGNANRELGTASQLYRKVTPDFHFLPPTEAQKAIQENKARIMKMEQ